MIQFCSKKVLLEKEALPKFKGAKKIKRESKDSLVLGLVVRVGEFGFHELFQLRFAPNF
jgi:hypothetical protein